MTALQLLPFTATVVAAVLLLMTQGWHGRLTLDSTVGVQKQHLGATTRVGGVAIAAGVLVAYVAGPKPAKDFLGPMLVASIPAFAAGLLEDLTNRVAVSRRLLATMASGALAWLLTGVAMRDTGLWGLDYLLTFTPFAVAFTAFVVAGVANATNIIDGFNGLAAGVVAIMLTAMGLMALQVAQSDLAGVAFALAGVAIGFGAVNWPRGKIFMGDGGAYLLGFLVAWVAILLPMGSPTINGWATLLACSYPVIEAVFSMRRRIKHKSPGLGQPDRRHLHHFIHRRVIRKVFPDQSRVLQNALTGALVWICAAIPAMWAVMFCQNTAALVVGFCLALVGYSAVFARLTQFVWCFQAATMRQRDTQPA